ncbi:MAG: EAL domain-containing protein [Pseudomonadaceae bacterium]|nr:EAL domain-containing protein [Pseudomonadaceae bacterium]
MKKRLTRNDQAAPTVSPETALRQRAENIAAQLPTSPVQGSEASWQTLHELRVHQIELEMQNEELRRTQAQVETARERYFDLYDLAPVGYCTVNSKGLILQANLTATQLLGVVRSELVKQPLTRFITHEDQDIFYHLRTQLIATGEPQSCELRMRKAGSAAFWAHLEATTALDDTGAPALRIVLSDCSARKQAEAALADSHAALHSILETTLDGFWHVDAQGCLLDVNPAYCQQSGYSRAELLGMPISTLIDPEHMQEATSRLANTLRLGHQQFESLHRRKDQSLWHVEVSSTYQNVAGGQYFMFLRDISKRKQAEEKLELAASVFSHSREGIMITAADSTILNVNAAFTRITGFSRDEALGQTPRLLRSGRQGQEFYASMWHNLEQKGHWYGEIWNKRKNGELYVEMQTISAVRDARGNVVRYVALFSDITEAKQHQSELEHIAHYDALTSLPNRVLLADRLHQAIVQTLRRGQLLEVVFLDLDGFKTINDKHGHEAGDQLLIALAAGMKQALRECDTLARIGGDEFVAVLVDLPDVASSMPMLERLLAAASQPVQVGELVLQVSASMGVTLCPQEEEVDADTLLRQADQAMYQAKLAGKNRAHFFDLEQDRSVRGHHESLAHIRQALAAHEFVLHYQPKVNLRTGAVIGAEALIRWQHPQRGLLAPAEFLPVIENHPLAIEIGEWVLTSALTQLERWHAEGLNISVSVNIGALQLQQKNFVTRLLSILATHPQVSPSNLELEVLETSALEDIAHVSRVILACQAIGVRFALDDFGTGYSSLTYLKRLPITLLKIDQSFVCNMLNDPDDLSILKGVISLASAFHLQVIAEGVETVEHGAMLLQLGCELAQGYGIARPMPAHQLPSWAVDWWLRSGWNKLPQLSQADLPLLFAGVELRAWTNALESHLKGERPSPPPLNAQHSHFGQWLKGDGLTRHGNRASFAGINALHQRLHTLAAELCELHSSTTALARFGELDDLQATLLEQLRLLMTDNRPA